MQYEIMQHRAIVRRISELHAADYDFRKGTEPISAKCRDTAYHLLSRRPDIAMGAVIEGIPEGGLRIDIIRNGGDYLFDLSGRGEISLVTSGNVGGSFSGNIYARSIGEAFFRRLDGILEDPISDTSFKDLPDEFPVAAQEVMHLPDAGNQGATLMSSTCIPQVACRLR